MFRKQRKHTIDQSWIPAIREMFRLIIARDFARLDAMRMLNLELASDFECELNEIRDIGGELISPTIASLDRACVIPSKKSPGMWFVDLSVWTESGESDWVIRFNLTVPSESGGEFLIEIQDLLIP